MKKLLKVLAVVVLGLTPFFIGPSASALAVCDVGYTGPDSQNMCRSITKYACDVTNNSVVDIRNEDNQVVASGSVSNSGNNQAGGSTTGSVTNSSGTTFEVTITHPGFDGTCVAAAIVPATEQPETPVAAPTQNPVQPTVSSSGQVVILPDTSSGISQTVLVIAVASLAAIATLGVGSIALYRYYKSL